MKMTRELQRSLKEQKKTAENTARSIAKKYGYKRIAGFIYKVRGDMLIWLDWTIAIDREEPEFMWSVYLKAHVLDDIFWDIFLMKEEVADKPFSFHVNGAFTAEYLKVCEYRRPMPDEMTADYFEAAFVEADRQAEHIFDEIPDVAAFETAIDNSDKPGLYLTEKILCRIYRGDLKAALVLAEESILAGEEGGYVNLDKGKGFMQLASEYCRNNL